MQMRSRAEAGASDIADTLAGADIRPVPCPDNAHMTVQRAVAGMVADYHIIPKDSVIAGIADTAGHCRPDGGSHTPPDVNTGMKLRASAERILSVTVRRGYGAV